MERSNDPLTVTEEDEIWGTWEELLLACARYRHAGPPSCGLVAARYAHRIHLSLTASRDHACRRRYRHLKRRFSGSEGGDGINGGDESDEKEPTVEIPWLDELRRLRVAELRREVQRYDVSIGSLQLKVKKMKEERERNLSKPEADGGGGDGDNGHPDPDRGALEVEDEGGKGPRPNDSDAATQIQSFRRCRCSSSADVESQPLIAFLETIRSNKDGSVFDRRLESQENVRYRSQIRRHVDLEIVKDRIGRKGYTSVEFFRDLLLLCNNALVFYPKNSPESISAVHLRDLVNKGIATALRKTPQTSPQSAKEATPPPAQQPHPASSKPKSDSGTNEKPAPLPPLVACRKRSAITAKPIKPKNVEKVEKAEIETAEDGGEIEDENKDREPATNKKSTKQQRTAVSRGLRTNKTRTNTKGGGNAVKNPNPVSTPKPDPVEQDSKSTLAKKRSAADFLNRMKSSSPPETMKGSSSSRRGGGDQRKKTKEEGKREAAAAKKSVGRPPAKRAPSKRAREEKTYRGYMGKIIN
ncbi:LOW QUALITY PROTEIN: uncharacterized protein LOC109842496 [Asparagus officinalis]|uniref:LOW QUALITY PROTEIN: uncharacterized protein LOC109842496 n=1 Tax=Asparagus officinalis TaxID=4686 RepID=UPI00098E2E47|nr:LOW QUALITY PROTEIN: uncharacterized protein LOC109842496 [Asparagus officinalis]